MNEQITDSKHLLANASCLVREKWHKSHTINLSENCEFTHYATKIKKFQQFPFHVFTTDNRK